MVGSLCGSMALMGLNAVFGPALRHFGIADWQAGAMLSLAGMFMMISGAPWGRLSNRKGRKKIVVFGLSGMGLSLLLIAGVIHLGLNASMSVLFITVALYVLRASMYFSYGAVPVAAQAWVADHTPPEKRSAAMATIGAAQGLGMIMGPAFAAVMSGLGWRAFLGDRLHSVHRRTRGCSMPPKYGSTAAKHHKGATFYP
jgi:MFS transporter, DHA1 family, tetracycline resistance protein